MDERNIELKRLKKASGQTKRKYVTGWQTAAIVFLVIALLFVPLSVAVQIFDNVVATRFGGNFWHLANKDKNASYFAEDLSLEDGSAQLNEQALEQAQAEGIVLLMNEGGALPLQAGTQVSCFGDDTLGAALAEHGFAVKAEGNAGTAIVVLSRAEDSEKTLLQSLCDKKATSEIEKIILLLNTENAMQLDFLKGNPYGVDAVLWMGDGAADAAAVLLAGTSPSGSLVNVWCYDDRTNPAAGNGVCREGIYVGYKYYETRYEDFVMGTEKTGDYAYQQTVAYPFGFGLGYTTFDYTQMGVVYNGETDRFEVSVTVTNTGNTAGREAVQVYAQSPYTDYDKQYAVEKAAVNLVGFAKTVLLEPGSSETVTVYVDKRDLASYDSYGAGTYILDAGNYYLTVATDAHNAVNNILAAKGYTAENTDGRMDAEGDVELTYQWVQDSFDDKTYASAKNGVAITNKLSGIDPVLQGETVTWLSRQDWEGTLDKDAVAIGGSDWQLVYDPGDHATVAMPTMGAKNGLKLYDMIGLDFDDPKWQTLLDQMTFAEMVSVVGDSYRWTMPVKSVQAPGARHGDADMQVSEELLSATFDTKLMYEVGRLMGNIALSDDETVLYCFGSGFEDGFLTGKLRAAQVQGVQSWGVNVVLKEQSTNIIWLNEQTAREQYLPAFQYAVEDRPTTGVMLSDRAEGLLEIMRQEWGSKGMAITGNVPAAGGILAGFTAFDWWLPRAETELPAYENDPVIVSALRQACHYDLYALANSAAMNGIGESTTVKVRALPLVTICRVVVAVSWVLFAVFTVMWCRGSKKWKKTAEYLDYRTMKVTLREEKKGE